MERHHKAYSSVPSLHKRKLKTSRVLVASNPKHKQRQLPDSDNVSFTQTLISRAWQDLESAYSVIHKLKRGRRSLKCALSETIQEKNSVYHEARFLQKKLQFTRVQNEQLRVELKWLQESQGLLPVQREGILKRDKLFTEQKPRTEIHSSIASLLEKVRPNSAVYLLLKKHIQCSHKFKEAIKTGGAEDGLLRILKFTTELIGSGEWTQNPFTVQLSAAKPSMKDLATVETGSLSIQSPTKIPKPNCRMSSQEVFGPHGS